MRLMRILVILMLLTGCNGELVLNPTPQAQPERLVNLVPTLIPTISQPTQETVPHQAYDSGWQSGSHGIEMRKIHIPRPDQPETTFGMTIVRIDPSQVRWRVGYTPENPQALRQWFEQRPALVMINGGFFQEDYRSTALVISDGQSNEYSYEGFGGMFGVDAGGIVSLLALSRYEYQGSEGFIQGLQSFPMLVYPGGEPTQPEDNGSRARRSAIAMDTNGRVLLIAVPFSAFTLTEFGLWLSQSDLEIDRALNLDGGASTGLFVSAGELNEQIDAFEPLPLVLWAEPRD
jgi:uncharacterized protein YigE (DUF2233 family)